MKPMLAHTSDKELSDYAKADFYYFQVKFDGTRIIAEKQGNEVKLTNRRGVDKTKVFPEITRALKTIPYNFKIDSEVVCDNDFRLLAQREHLKDQFKINLLADNQPCDMIMFDLLSLQGKDFTKEQYSTRYFMLNSLIPKTERTEIIANITHEKAIEKLKDDDIEGIMLKDKDSIYEEGKRSKEWLKIKKSKTEEFKVIGYQKSDKEHRKIRCLELGKEGQVVKVASGLTQDDIQQILDKGTHKLVAVVKYTTRHNLPYVEPRLVKLKWEGIK